MEEKYTLVITRMDDSKETYTEISDDDFDMGQNFIAINEKTKNRVKYINSDTVKEFEVFK